VLGELVCGCADIADNGSQRNTFFVYFGRPYNLGDLALDGRSCLCRSSLSEDFFSSCVVLRSMESVGSLVSFL